MISVATDVQAHVEIPPALLERVRSEFVEMPGLNLTTRQAARLWGLEPRMSERLLRFLEESGFLFRTRGDGFVLRPTR